MTGGAAGTAGNGTGGSAGGTAGTSGTGGSAGLPDASNVPDVSAPDVSVPPDVTGPPDTLADLPGGDCKPVPCSVFGATYCGLVGDGCGGIQDCGNCGAGKVCGARTPNVCDAPCPLCPQIPKCESGITTVHGKAVTGALTNPDPLYRATVFIPNVALGGKLPPLADGPSCHKCTAPTRDEAIAWTFTAADGDFVLTNVPTGAGIPLVVQLGDWRYETTIHVLPCVNNELPGGTARLPRTQLEGNIPLTAVSTGGNDALECILRGIGVADSEFSNPTGPGRIHFYRNNGASYDANTPAQSALVDSAATWDKYDQILFPCEGLISDETAPALTNFVDYTTKGGRVFATHYSFTWLYQNGPFATAGTWQTAQMTPIDPLIANVDIMNPRGQDFAAWLGHVGALSSANPPQVSIGNPRHDLNAVPAGQGGVRWLYSENPSNVQLMTVDTPVLVPSDPDKICGRVVFSDFHVNNTINMPTTFPAECLGGGVLTAQEKILEFMLLDLSFCGLVDPPPPPPPPPPLPPGD